jgi:hypothetical protein
MPLVFKETHFNELVKGTKYSILKTIGIHYTGTYIGYTQNITNRVVIFNNAKIIYRNNNSSLLKQIMFDDESREYYCVDFQTEQRQNAMELRAVNKILQQIIGDNTFKY